MSRRLSRRCPAEFVSSDGVLETLSQEQSSVTMATPLRRSKRKLAEIQPGNCEAPSPKHQLVDAPNSKGVKPCKGQDLQLDDPAIADTPTSGKFPKVHTRSQELKSSSIAKENTSLTDFIADKSPSKASDKKSCSSSEPTQSGRLVAKSFYGSCSKKYLNPVERKELGIPVLASVSKNEKVAETANEKFTTTETSGMTKSVLSAKRRSLVTEKRKSLLVNKPTEQTGDKKNIPKEPELKCAESRDNKALGKLARSPYKSSPAKKKFFKHRQASPSKKSRAKLGMSFKLRKGCQVKVKLQPTPSQKPHKGDRPLLLTKNVNKPMKPLPKLYTSEDEDNQDPTTAKFSPKQSSDTSEVNPESQDLFPDYSQHIPKEPSLKDSGCASEPSNGDYCHGSRSPEGTNVTDSWSNCSTASDSVALLSEVSSEMSKSPCSESSATSSIKSYQGCKKKKLFPIFTKSAGSSPSSSLPGTPNNSKRGLAQVCKAGSGKRSPKQLLKKIKDKDGKEQMTLDFGQKLLGAVQCSVCGMTYTHGEPTDEATHSKFHQRLLSALRFPGWKTERVVQEYMDGSRILVVFPDDKFATKKVSAIRGIVDQDLGFVVESKDTLSTCKTFLYISSDQQVIGCCVAEVISKGYRVLDPSSSLNTSTTASQNMDVALRPWCCSTDPEPARCGISRVWVLASHRRQRVATRMLDTVRTNFVMGYQVAKSELAFTDPTPNGKLLAASYCGTPCFLVYKHK